MGKPAALDTAIAEAAKLELSDAFFRRRLRRSRGFAALEDASVVVCVLPGTELSFAGEVSCGLLAWRARVIKHKTAVFRQIKKDWALGHRDALEFPDGQIVLLTLLCKGQQATVLQLPAEPKTDVKSEARLRAAFVG